MTSKSTSTRDVVEQHEGPIVATSSKPDLHAHLTHSARAGQLPLLRSAAVPGSLTYDPTAEPGDPAWREPLSDDEAAARTSWLSDQYRAARETAEIEGRPWHPELQQRSEVDEALADAWLDAHLSARAHDGDPDPARRVDALDALRDLRPTPPQPEHELADEHGDDHQVDEHDGEQGRDPGLALEDAWFRASLDDVVPADTPDRDAVLDRAVDHARTRFVDHGETTWPEQALAATRHHEPDVPDVEVPEVDHDEPEA